MKSSQNSPMNDPSFGESVFHQHLSHFHVKPSTMYGLDFPRLHLGFKRHEGGDLTVLGTSGNRPYFQISLRHLLRVKCAWLDSFTITPSAYPRVSDYQQIPVSTFCLHPTNKNLSLTHQNKANFKLVSFLFLDRSVLCDTWKVKVRAYWRLKLPDISINPKHDQINGKCQIFKTLSLCWNLKNLKPLCLVGHNRQPW